MGCELLMGLATVSGARPTLQQRGHVPCGGRYIFADELYMGVAQVLARAKFPAADGLR